MASELWRESEIFNINEETALLKLVKQGNAQARDRLIAANQRLVIAIAQRYSRLCPHLTLSDLIQEGNIGLFKAVDRFNCQEGLRFFTFAGYLVRQSIIKALYEQSHTIRLPNSFTASILKYKRAVNELKQKSGRYPEAEEISVKLNLSVKKITRFQRRLEYLLQKPVFIDARVSNNRDSDSIGEFIADKKNISPEDAAEQALLRQRIQKIFKKIAPREQKILELRYGLNDGIDRTLEEVGKLMGLTRERIRQIEKKLFKKIRKKLNQRRAGE